MCPPAGLFGRAANSHPMSGPEEQHLPGRLIARRVEKKGLKPRVAASIIAVLWLIAVVIFGIVEHLIDPDTFDTIWLGMWWATQTVTTVGYGDVVPVDTAGQLMATVLMIGGLSLFAVVTGFITSAFVARAQAEARASLEDPTISKLLEIEAQLAAIRADVARLSPPGDQGHPGPD
jgi:voltage-gated potassium channel